MARDKRKQDPLDLIRKALTISAQHYRIAAKYEKQVLEILDAQRAKLTPLEWETFKTELNYNDEVIAGLRASVDEEEQARRLPWLDDRD